MKMQEKGKKSRAEYVCGINLRQDTSRQLWAYCFRKGWHGIHYIHIDTQIYYIPKHLKYKWIPWPYFEGYNINLTLTDVVVRAIVMSERCTRLGWRDSWRDYAV
jgi:hypothetical protein